MVDKPAAPSPTSLALLSYNQSQHCRMTVPLFLMLRCRPVLVDMAEHGGSGYDFRGVQALLVACSTQVGDPLVVGGFSHHCSVVLLISKVLFC